MKRFMTVILTLCLCLGGIPYTVYGNTDTNIKPKSSIKKVQKGKYIEGEAIVLLNKSAASTVSKTTVLSKSLAQKLELPSDVKIKDKLIFSEVGKADSKSVSPYIKGDDGSVIINISSDKYSTEKLVKVLKKLKSVKYAEPNYICSANDSKHFAGQWALDNTGQNNGTVDEDLNLDAIWNTNITNKGNKKSDTIVAVVDSGIDYNHESLKDNMWINGHTGRLAGKHGFDFADYDNDPMDDNGHGTHVAGIIGGKGADSNGISGVDRGIKIMALKFLDSDGYGDLFDALSAYEYIDKAISLGYKVRAVNNSWGGSEDEESDIFKEAVDNIGAKGCISVCAAGNYGTDNDELAEFPANVDSIYNVSVAASNEDGQLASFSNYGKETVDIAAPGTGILSSVSYNCYNPTLYAASSALNNKYYDYETTTGAIQFQNWHDGDWEYTGTVGGSTTFDISDDDFFGYKSSNGHSLKWTIDDVSEEGVYNMIVPYTSTNSDVPIQMSAAVKIKTGPTGGTEYDYGGIVLVSETTLPGTGKIPDRYKSAEDIIWGNMIGAAATDQPMNYWESINETISENSKAGKNRALVFSYVPLEGGEKHEIYLDDIGISKGGSQGADDEYGKYAFYSGTSMAAPMVTGSLALLSEAKPGYTTPQLALEIKNMTDKSKSKIEAGKTGSGGVLDLGDYNNSKPHIMGAKIMGNNVVINGFEFGTTKGTVKVGGKPKAVSTWKNTAITIAASGVKNKNIEFEVVNSKNQTAKATVYVVAGKTSFKEDGTVADSYGGSLTTDGKHLYSAGSDGTFNVLETYTYKKKKYQYWEELEEINPKTMFPDATPGELDSGEVTFETELTYLNGYFYGIACLDTGYSSCLALAAYDVKKDKWTRAADCPGAEVKAANLTSAFKNIRMSSLATYNGKLYLMGGFNTSTEKTSAAVRVFNTKTNKWSGSKSMPEGRFLGVARQSGNKLVLSMGGNGKSDNSATAPLIFNGKSWKKGKAVAAMTNSDYYIMPETEKNDAKTIRYFNAAVGIVKGGLIYSGLPADNLGDTYTYSLSKGTYSASPYQYSEKTDNEEVIGIALGSKFYVTSVINLPEYYDEDFEDWGSSSSNSDLDEFDDLDDLFYSEALYSMPVKSGLYKVTGKTKYKKGKVLGMGTYLPGQKVVIKTAPKKKYYAKKLTIGSKKTKKGKYTIKGITKNYKVKASFAKYKTTVKLNKTKLTAKAGSKVKLKAKVSKPAFKNKKVKWKVSNKKYATVNSKGKVKLKKKGKGKTVKIIAIAKDGSKAKAVCKITIK